MTVSLGQPAMFRLCTVPLLLLLPLWVIVTPFETWEELLWLWLEFWPERMRARINEHAAQRRRTALIPDPRGKSSIYVKALSTPEHGARLSAKLP